ncbi:MAG: DUF4332 domain-containing protein [Gemmatimonadales bacterium]|jgi:hypothetical protein
MIAFVALCAFALAWVLLLLDVDPVPTWFYVFAWYPVLVLADVFVRRMGRGSAIFRSPAQVASLFGWSAVIWLVFEVANFRLGNWYYVFLPARSVERWGGILISFATVVPAVILAERTLATLGVGRRWSTAPLPHRPQDLTSIQGLGLGMAALAMLFPRTFFPLVWGAAWLLVDPIVWRYRPAWSLLADLARGEWGRLGRLMLGGLGIGLLWEFLNFWARGKWVYSVPWLEGTKLFEMPPLGFLGFPFFALEAWAMYHLLCVIGIAVPASGGPGRQDLSRPTRRVLGIAPRVVASVPLAVVFAAITLLGMERRTISSVGPEIREMPGISEAETAAITGAGIGSPFALAKARPSSVATRTGLPPARAAQLVELSRLVTLRGIGANHTTRLHELGVSTVCALARWPPAVLWRAYHSRDPERGTRSLPGPMRPTTAEVRMWIGTARRECTERWETHASPGPGN